MVALAAILLTAGLAWLYLFRTSMMPESMAGMDMAAPDILGWSWTEASLLFAMWAVMMVAMMLPSAAPMILLFSKISVRRSAAGTAYTPVAFFAAGYLITWWAFSAAAAVIQWALHSAAVLSPGMRATSPLTGAAILVAAGIYQWLPLKQSCLRHCRTPFSFISTEWREGRAGAVRMGLKHGAFCVGCCWLLMALLFVAGVMNLAWVAALSVIVLMEKSLAAGPSIARASGVLFVAAGIYLIVSANI